MNEQMINDVAENVVPEVAQEVVQEAAKKFDWVQFGVGGLAVVGGAGLLGGAIYFGKKGVCKLISIFKKKDIPVETPVEDEDQEDFLEVDDKNDENEK